jgi:hypothetical protein
MCNLAYFLDILSVNNFIFIYNIIYDVTSLTIKPKTNSFFGYLSYPVFKIMFIPYNPLKYISLTP